MNSDNSNNELPPQGRTRDRASIELLQAVLDRLRITQWDLTFVGDGSGTGWADACGWAGILIDRETLGRRLIFGGMNQGSINLAELMPYLQALTWYHANVGQSRLKTSGQLNVHIITDSQVIAGHGTTAANMMLDLPRVQQPLWAAMREFVRLGYKLHFHWANRSDTQLNVMADLVAALSRRVMLTTRNSAEPEINTANKIAELLNKLNFCDPVTGEPISIYHLNP